VNTPLKATGNASKLQKIHHVYLSNKTWKRLKVCVERQTVPNDNYCAKHSTNIG